jgi:retron-type reverse transcriptase
MEKHEALIEDVVDWQNLIHAHKLARRGKRSNPDVAYFETNLWEELGKIQIELMWHTYQPGRYRSFVVYEPKKREILAAPYRDRVVQHAICNVCGPIWDRSMIFDTYACRAGKGTHAGANRVEKWLKGMVASGTCWVLKMDVSKYFFSIRHRLAKEVIRDYIHCYEVLALLDVIIDSTACQDESDPVGIPVGNLTSQWIANLVLNRVDQWAKRELRLKRYIRYMDDMVVLVRSKEEALYIKDEFESKLLSLGLKFSKASVLPSSKGINFLGYRIWANKRLLRKDSVRRMKRRIKTMRWQYARNMITIEKVNATIASWTAHACHANTDNLRKGILCNTVFKSARRKNKNMILRERKS